MIFDSIRNRALYEALHPSFTAAFDFIERASREVLPVGTYELDGRRLYGSVQEYGTKAPTDAAFEAHRRYIDIQFIDKGSERMLLSGLDRMTVTVPYDDTKDVAFYADCDAPVTATVSAGEYGIFFPGDVHKPGLSVGEASAPVRKILVKIAI